MLFRSEDEIDEAEVEEDADLYAEIEEDEDADFVEEEEADYNNRD